MTPVFSVISPSYGQGRYVGQCLASVALQGDLPYEHLVLDAGSKDETAEVTARFPHARFVDLPGSTQSEALNEGFRLARGRYVAWLNTDDVLLPGAFARALSALESAGPRANVTSHFLLVGDGLELLERRRMWPFSPHVYRNAGGWLPTSGSFLTNTVHADGIRLVPDLHVIMDHEFHLQLHARGYRFVAVDGYLSAFRAHETNRSGILQSLRGTLDPGRERRREERRRIVRAWGGLHAFGRRLLPPSRALTDVTRLALVAGLRGARLRAALDSSDADDVARSLLANWKEQLDRTWRRTG